MEKMHLLCLKKAIERLGQWIPFNEEELICHYRNRSDSLFEVIGPYQYLLFCWPELDQSGAFPGSLSADALAYRLVLLVFDEQLQIIADISGIHASMQDFMTSGILFDHLCEDSDWSYLEHYTLAGSCFPELPYPLCEQNSETLPFDGEAILYTNAYVTRAYRQQHIFTNMVEMMKYFALRYHSDGNIPLYQVFTMDPDVACYGPDTSSEPYIYSFEKDEPERLRNAEIARHLGFEPIRLEELEHDPQADGTKLWFCIRREIVTVSEKCTS